MKQVPLAYTVGSMVELELELIQTHMAQKPMLRVEVGALGARQAIWLNREGSKQALLDFTDDSDYADDSGNRTHQKKKIVKP